MEMGSLASARLCKCVRREGGRKQQGEGRRCDDSKPAALLDEFAAILLARSLRLILHDGPLSIRRAHRLQKYQNSAQGQLSMRRRPATHVELLLRGCTRPARRLDFRSCVGSRQNPVCAPCEVQCAAPMATIARQHSCPPPNEVACKAQWHTNYRMPRLYHASPMLQVCHGTARLRRRNNDPEKLLQGQKLSFERVPSRVSRHAGPQALPVNTLDCACKLRKVMEVPQVYPAAPVIAFLQHVMPDDVQRARSR